MSRKVNTDHKYNEALFIELVNKAKGNRTQQQFADDCGISYAYLTRIINGKYTKAPTPKVIKQLYDGREGDVSFSEMLHAAGYDPLKHMRLFDPFEMGYKIKNLMAKRGYTRKYLAQKMNASERAITSWTSGEQLPSLSSIHKLADALMVDVSYFLSEVELSQNTVNEAINEIPLCKEMFLLDDNGKDIVLAIIQELFELGYTKKIRL